MHTFWLVSEDRRGPISRMSSSCSSTESSKDHRGRVSADSCTSGDSMNTCTTDQTVVSNLNPYEVSEVIPRDPPTRRKVSLPPLKAFGVSKSTPKTREVHVRSRSDDVTNRNAPCNDSYHRRPSGHDNQPLLSTVETSPRHSSKFETSRFWFWNRSYYTKTIVKHKDRRVCVPHVDLYICILHKCFSLYMYFFCVKISMELSPLHRAVVLFIFFSAISCECHFAKWQLDENVLIQHFKK